MEDEAGGQANGYAEDGPPPMAEEAGGDSVREDQGGERGKDSESPAREMGYRVGGAEHPRPFLHGN